MLALLMGTTPARSARFLERPETLNYRWQLEGVSGAIARLLRLLPTKGDGVMKLQVTAGERLSITFLATSEKAKPDEYWKYETAVDIESWRSLLVSDSVRFGRKDRTKIFDLEELEVTDVLSGLHLLRHAAPEVTEQRTLWSDGKLYAVTVVPGGRERRTVGGKEMTLRKLTVSGAKGAPERRWKARAEIWLSDDDDALPVEIVYHQSLGRLRLTLVGSTP